MSASVIHQDQSLLSRCDQALLWLETRLNLTGGIIVLFIVLFSVINIVGRGMFNQPFNAYFDLMGQSVPLIAFMGLSYCQRDGGHIRMDLLIGRVKGRALWVIEAVTSLLTFLLISVLAYGAWLHANRSITLGDSTEDIGLIIWPFKLMLVAMFIVLLARLLIQLWGYARLIVKPQTKPIAVPIIEDVAAQAEREAKTATGMQEIIQQETGQQETSQ